MVQYWKYLQLFKKTNFYGYIIIIIIKNVFLI